MTSNGSRSDLKPFVIVNNDGIQYIGLHHNEEDCWRIFLGWPTRGEVIYHMNLGYCCYPANVTWCKE